MSKVRLSQQEMVKDLPSKSRMQLPPIRLKVPGKTCVLAFRAEIVGRAIQQETVALGTGIQSLQISCSRKGARELSDPTCLPSYLPSSCWCLPLDKPNRKPEGKGLRQAMEPKEVSLTRVGWRRLESRSKGKKRAFSAGFTDWLSEAKKNTYTAQPV